MKTSLYEIKKDYLEIVNELELSQGELTTETEYKLKINKSELGSKSIAYTSVITTKESLNTQIDAEIKRLQAMKKANNNVIDRLKFNLLSAVEMFGYFTVGLTKFSIRKSSQVKVDDINLLPKEYKTIKVVETADKKAIKDALKLGKDVKGSYIEEINNLKIN